MYPIDQYIVKIDCPLSNTIEEVAFHEVEHAWQYYAKFDGCDHQFSKCPECEACREKAYQLMIKRAD